VTEHAIAQKYWGHPPSTCPADIMLALKRDKTLSSADIHSLLPGNYAKRTVIKYLGELRRDGKIACVANGDMRRPRYRLVQQ
jgi:hypothetical protein